MYITRRDKKKIKKYYKKSINWEIAVNERCE